MTQPTTTLRVGSTFTHRGELYEVTRIYTRRDGKLCVEVTCEDGIVLRPFWDHALRMANG